jgi:ABC-type Mn2+/Zn2+ transport system ATPase subunit
MSPLDVAGDLLHLKDIRYQINWTPFIDYTVPGLPDMVGYAVAGVMGFLIILGIGYLSYGEKKLVTIASALVHDPEVILLDEPTAFLSRRHVRRIVSIIRQLSINSKTLIIATHDPCLLSITKSVVVLRNGITETMSMTEAYNDEYVSDLLGLNRDCAHDA